MDSKKFKRINLNIITLILLLIVSLTFSLGLSSPKAEALSGSQFNPGRIMDESVFFNPNTMTAQQIQSFLNAKMPSCDTNGEKMYNSTQTRAQWARANGKPQPPYICLKNYSQSIPGVTNSGSDLCAGNVSGGTKSAARIISDVAYACGISPKVLIVLLQKEQSLVTDDWPWPVQYRSATGYGCPDTAPCDSEYYGFFNQVYQAAKAYQRYKANPTNYNYRAGRNNTILWHPNAACGSSTVYIENQATAGLYIYTPYRPNQSALNNLYGTGDSCSSYGNRNFWRMYNDWFGSTLTNIAYDAVLESAEIYTDASRTQKYTKSILSIEPGSKAYVRIQALNTGWKNWDQSFTRIGRHGSDTSVFSSTWFKTNRPAQLVEGTVVPGQVGTFEFELTAPATPGSFEEKFQMLIEGKIWLNIKLNNIIHVTEPALGQATKNRLSAGEELLPGESLLSPDQHNTLVLQKDGNLVLYSTFFAKWHTSSARKEVSKLTMQTDGNLVLYSTSGKAIWHTSTYNNPGAYLIMQTDGNMVIYSSSGSALWRSSTIERPDLLSYISPALYDKGFLHKGQQIETADRKYKLTLQYDGNLVLYSNSSGKALWHTRTYRQPSYRLDMQHDGNLVLYDINGDALWNSRTAHKGYSRLVVQPDGNLVIYDKNSKATWNSGTQNRE